MKAYHVDYHTQEETRSLLIEATSYRFKDKFIVFNIPDKSKFYIHKDSIILFKEIRPIKITSSETSNVIKIERS